MSGFHGYDGPTLRSLRESSGVALRKVARQAGMSHGHLSKVERAEPGRPVTPAVLAAYQAATGVRLVGAAEHRSEAGSWRRGQLSEVRRRTFIAKIAAVAVGGPLAEQVDRMLDATGRLRVPDRVDDADVVGVEHAARTCTRIDLHLGGGVAAEQARALLRWAAGMLQAEVPQPVAARLHAAIGALAQRAGWAAMDADSHDVARTLLTIGVFAAERADDADLRAHLLGDVAAQHNYLGYPDDCLQVVRFGEADERVGAAVRMVLYGIKARAYAVKGDVNGCREQVALAERAHGQAAAAAGNLWGGPAPDPFDGGDWRTGVASTGHLFAVTGHALATLARRSGSAPDREDAAARLAKAFDEFDPARQTRPAALCALHLAVVLLESGEGPRAVEWTRRALPLAQGVRSCRVVDQLRDLRTVAETSDDPAARDLLDALRAAPHPLQAESATSGGRP